MFTNFWPFRRRRLTAKPAWGLDFPLLRWSRRDVWMLGHALEGTLCLGATGGGKSSGSGRALALAMLRTGYFGGVVLTAKSDERQLWESYCQEAGREDDLIILGPDSWPRFNFLGYEMKRGGVGAGIIENIVNLFSTVLEIAERSAAGGGREEEGYWKRSNRQLVRNAVDLLALATESVSVPDLYRLVISAPTSPALVASNEWQRNSFCFQCLKAADGRPKTAREEHDYGIVADYFLLEFPALSDKTRSIVVSTFTSMIDVLNRGILREIFCTETNITPELTESGKIIVVDFPVKEFAEVGQFAQVLFKYAFQRSIERRDVSRSPRPVFLWADEAQHFVTSYDMMFQATCRSARVATVLLSQNVSNFYAALGGGDKGRVEADSLFANLNTKIFHANSDPVTNEWAASLIGRTRQFFINGNTSYGQDAHVAQLLGLSPDGQGCHSSAGFSESYEYEVQPSAFTQLRTGGEANDRCVDAIVFQNGRLFGGSGRTWQRVTFRQAG